MNLNNSVTHCVAADNKGSLSLSLLLCACVCEKDSFIGCISNKDCYHLSVGFKFEAAKRHGDIIHYTWVLDCYSQKKLVRLQPK